MFQFLNYLSFYTTKEHFLHIVQVMALMSLEYHQSKDQKGSAKHSDP